MLELIIGFVGIVAYLIFGVQANVEAYHAAIGEVRVIAPISIEEEWSEFHAESFAEHADQFTALFESYSYKLSKNGRSMVNGKFVKMGATK